VRLVVVFIPALPQVAQKKTFLKNKIKFLVYEKKPLRIEKERRSIAGTSDA
jgi:hypothetical protein